MPAFWDVEPCSLEESANVSKVLTVSIVRAMMEAVNTSETSAYFYQATRRNIPKDNHLHTCNRMNLKSYQKISDAQSHGMDLENM
jgi:hypothetical protein